MEYYVKGPLVCLLDYANLKGKTRGTRSTCYHPNVVVSDPQGLKKSPGGPTLLSLQHKRVTIQGDTPLTDR